VESGEVDGEGSMADNAKSGEANGEIMIAERSTLRLLGIYRDN
jgi:hypothetical protein